MGSLYIPPVAPENLAPSVQQPWVVRPKDTPDELLQTPAWMASKNNPNESPEWVHKDDINRQMWREQGQQQSQQQQPQKAQPQTGSGNFKEHVVPIQMESTPTRTPSTPGFGPQPFYNPHQQQFSSVSSPNTGGIC